MNNCRNHARRRWRWHAYKVFRTARGHALHVEPRQSPGTANQKRQAADPAKLVHLLKCNTAILWQGTQSPSVCQDRRRDSETHDVRDRIKLHAEIGVCLQQPRQPAIQRIKQDCEANGLCGMVKIISSAQQRRHNRKVAAEQVSNGEEAGDEKDAPAAQFLTAIAPFLERDLVLICIRRRHDLFPDPIR